VTLCTDPNIGNSYQWSCMCYLPRTLEATKNKHK